MKILEIQSCEECFNRKSCGNNWFCGVTNSNIFGTTIPCWCPLPGRGYKEMKKMKWIYPNNKLPEDGSVVLVWSLTSDEAIIAGFNLDAGEREWTTEDEHCSPIEVSAWMLLPERPYEKT